MSAQTADSSGEIDRNENDQVDDKHSIGGAFGQGNNHGTYKSITQKIKRRRNWMIKEWDYGYLVVQSNVAAEIVR